MKVQNKIAISSLTNILITSGGILISFLISVLLTRFFGPKNYGDYVLVYSWIELLALISLFGLNKLFVVFIPKLISNDAALSLIFKKYFKIGLLISCLISIGSFFSSYLDLPFFNGNNTRFFFRYGSLIIPIFSLSLYRQYFLVGLKHVIHAQFPEKIIKPIIFLTLAILIYYLNFDVQNLVYAYIFSILVSFVIGYFILRSKFKITDSSGVNSDVIPELTQGLKLIVITNIIGFIGGKIDTLMIGSLLNISDVGIYNIFFKLSTTITLSLIGMRMVVSPSISALIEEEKHVEARKILKQNTRLALIIGFIIAFILILSREYIYSLFGKYSTQILSENSIVLFILIAMQLFSLVVGPIANILLVQKAFKPLLIGQLIYTLTNIVLNFVLIPIYGLVGAALATTTSLVLWYGFLIYINKSNKFLNPTAFGK